MTIYERFEEIKDTTELRLENAKNTYLNAEQELLGLVGDYVMGAEVYSTLYGPGHIISYKGETLDGLIVNIEFATAVKMFSLMHIITNGTFVKFVDTLEIGIIWNDAFAVHNELAAQFKELTKLSEKLEYEAKKKAEEEKRAEAKYQAAKAKAIQEFQEWTQTYHPVSAADEFYYVLGWLAKHVGTITAALPDYLENEFKGYFGPDTPCRIVDSKKRGPAGYQSQWTKSFSVSLKKPELIPSLLTQHLNPKRTAVTDTNFVLDLIDNYGFKFGKEQDIEKIRACVPTAHIAFFENGLA